MSIFVILLFLVILGIVGLEAFLWGRAQGAAEIEAREERIRQGQSQAHNDVHERWGR